MNQSDRQPLPLWQIPIAGDLIGGVYEIVGEIGSGAMGVVLLAIDQQLGRKVAIKLIHSRLCTSDFRERFLREARAMAELNHPNVLGIYAFGQHGSSPYFVMEFVEGTTLDRLIAEQGAAIDFDLAFRILYEICAAVQAMHDANMVHRDLKPANILLDRQMHVRVADLGMAQKFLGDAAIPEFVGTPGYIAPELVFEGEQATNAGPRSDVYSLGCIAFELLTGQAPFDAGTDFELMALHATAKVPPPTSMRRDLPHALNEVLWNALAKDPEHRTSSAAILHWELRTSRRTSHDPKRILVAEDDVDFRDLLDIKLRIEFPDAEVECVSDGQAALDALERNPVSVVILDLMMPVLDGVALTVQLRARSEYARVPILVLTASGGPNEWKFLSSIGADRFLVKPVDLDDVVTLVRRIIRERESTL